MRPCPCKNEGGRSALSGACSLSLLSDRVYNTIDDTKEKVKYVGLLNRISSCFTKGSFASCSSDERGEAIDEGARQILEALEDAGAEGYIVGGCVRDLAMGKMPHDWDITTSARPEGVQHVAASHGWKAIDGGGRRFGTVILVLGGQNYEVTTFRSERYGSDAHRPSEVSFAKTLTEDLMRRDFTVNAMAMDRSGRLYDEFGGLSDIERKRLRAVGDASLRFSEDALRLFRACRFVAQLDFMADRSLVDGMPGAFSRVGGLSLERVRSEVDRLLVSAHAARGMDLMVRSGLAECSCRIKEQGAYRDVPILPELTHLVGLPQQKEFHKYDAWYHTLAVLEAAPPTLVSRWAALLHDVAKGMPGIRAIRKGRLTDYGHDKKGAQMTEAIFTRWHRTPAFTKEVVWLVENHMRFHFFANSPEADAKKWVRQLARDRIFPSSEVMAEHFLHLRDLCKADIIGCGRPLSATEGHDAFGEYMAELARRIPVTPKDLHYSKDVPGIFAPHVAEGMSNLLSRVQNGSLENTEEALHEAALRFVKKHEG